MTDATPTATALGLRSSVSQRADSFDAFDRYFDCARVHYAVESIFIMDVGSSVGQGFS